MGGIEDQRVGVFEEVGLQTLGKIERQADHRFFQSLRPVMRLRAAKGWSGRQISQMRSGEQALLLQFRRPFPVAAQCQDRLRRLDPGERLLVE